MGRALAEVHEQGHADGLIYDSVLGWANLPDYVSAENTVYNSQGLLTTSLDKTYASDPEPNVLRIALLGNSFTGAGEVAYPDAWSYLLEAMLETELGQAVEVINFAVNASSTDQAFLRWQRDVKPFKPDVVIFGLQSNNIFQNTNVFRYLFNRAGLPYSKPRFVLEDGELVLYNQPAIPPDAIISALHDNTPLLQAENSLKDEPRPWHFSKFLSLVETQMHSKDTESAAESTEEEELLIAILDAFAEDVEAADALFIIATMPTRSEIAQTLRQANTLASRYVSTLSKRHFVINTAAVFNRMTDDDWMSGSHYSASTNQRVAEYVAAQTAHRLTGVEN
jgi:hypothetical protein